MQGVHRPLLGRPAIEPLVVKVEPVLEQKAVVLKFPQRMEDLGVVSKVEGPQTGVWPWWLFQNLMVESGFVWT